MRELLVLFIACLALTLAACGDDDDDDGGGDSAGTTATTEQTDTRAAPEPEKAEKAEKDNQREQQGEVHPPSEPGDVVEVDIPDISFNRGEVKIYAGTTVKWTNSDDLRHTVTKDSGPGPDFDSGDIQPGDEFEQTFDEPGEVGYVCTIHPGQSGRVVVVQG